MALQELAERRLVAGVMAGIGQEGAGHRGEAVLPLRERLKQRQGPIELPELKTHIALDQTKPRRAPQGSLDEIQALLGPQQGMGGGQPLGLGELGLGIGRRGPEAGAGGRATSPSPAGGACLLASTGHGIDGSHSPVAVAAHKW